MSPRKKISDADRELFRHAVADVKPLPEITPPAPAVVKKARRRISAPAPHVHTLEINDVMPLRSGDVMEFARNGIAPRTLVQMRRGTMAPTATLDLHGLRAKSAQIHLQEFLQHCNTQGERCVRIIHGKGRGPNDAASVLKSIVNHWLRDQASVLAFCSAPVQDGGVGAVYVLLKRSPV